MKAASAQHDLCDARHAREFCDLIGDIIPIDRFYGCAQLLSQMNVGLKPVFIFLCHPLKCFGLYKQRGKTAPESACHAGGCANDLWIRGG